MPAERCALSWTSGPTWSGSREWYPVRFRILLDSGSPGLVPHLGARWPHREAAGGTLSYLWKCVPLLGGCAVGARADRFELVRCWSRLLSRPGFADREEHRRTLEPGRAATLSVYRDLFLDRTVCLVISTWSPVSRPVFATGSTDPC